MDGSLRAFLGSYIIPNRLHGIARATRTIAHRVVLAARDATGCHTLISDELAVLRHSLRCTSAADRRVRGAVVLARVAHLAGGLLGFTSFAVLPHWNRPSSDLTALALSCGCLIKLD